MIPLAEGAIQLGLTVRRLQALCQQRRVPGARLVGRSWFLPADFKVTPGTRGSKSLNEDAMNADNLTQLEARLANVLRNEINTWLRDEAFDNVTVMDLKIVARRFEGVGPEAQYQFDIKPKFVWTWKRADATIG